MLAACLISAPLNSCTDMATSVPRTQLHSTDLSPDDFGMVAEKIVARSGLGGPYQLTEGTIADYENQSGKIDLVWYGGSESDPACIWLVFPDDSSVKIKWPAPSELGFCQTVIDCIIADLAKGGGTRERYLILGLEGPDWSIVEVLYGENDDAQFSTIVGESLIDLVGQLNGAESLPEDWLFSIDSGNLVLSTPYGTDVTAVELGSGLVVEFDGPTFEGAPASSLSEPMAEALAGPLDSIIEQYEEILGTYTGLLGESVEYSAATTEAAIETAYAAYLKAMVRWTDADGDARISYKDPVNGWYHPVTKYWTPSESWSSAFRIKQYPAGASTPYSFDVEEFHSTSGIPEDATKAFVQIKVEIASGQSGLGRFIVRVKEPSDPASGSMLELECSKNGTDTQRLVFNLTGWVNISSKDFFWETDRTEGTLEADIYVKPLGWSR